MPHFNEAGFHWPMMNRSLSSWQNPEIKQNKVDGLAKPFPFAGHFGRDRLQESVEYLLEHRPRTVSICVGEQPPGGGGEAQVEELALTTLEAAFLKRVRNTLRCKALDHRRPNA
jgi:hypothetical protein